MPGELRSSAAFRASLRDRLKRQALSAGRPFQQLEREFVLQRFLARVFASPDSLWVLKGGTGLLVRLPGARFSQDLDLVHPAKHLPAALNELERLGASPGGDPFRFVLGGPVLMTGGVAGARVKVDVYLGAATPFGRFPVDLSTELEMIARVETRQPLPVLEMPDVATLPRFRLYPLPDQIADKVCAMYELHGRTQSPSSRYRDLVDLVLITSNFTLGAADAREAMLAESGRRGLELPNRLRLPSRNWVAGYRSVARGTAVPVQLQEVHAALSAAGQCLDPLLDGHVERGVWDPHAGRWTESS